MKKIKFSVYNLLAKDIFNESSDLSVLKYLLISEKFLSHNGNIIKTPGNYIRSYSINLKSMTPQRDLMFAFDKPKFFSSKDTFIWFTKCRCPVVNIHNIVVKDDKLMEIDILKLRKNINIYQFTDNHEKNPALPIKVTSSISSYSDLVYDPIDIVNKLKVTLYNSNNKSKSFQKHMVLYYKFGKQLSTHMDRKIMYKEFVKKFIPFAKSIVKSNDIEDFNKFKELYNKDDK